MKKETRIYPTCCTSMYCGEVECPDNCKNLKYLNEFKQWVKEHNAIVEDKIYSPCVYTSTIE